MRSLSSGFTGSGVSARGGRNRRLVLSESARRGILASIECLERRQLLSVSAQTLAGPVTIAGNSWTYDGIIQGTVMGTETLTSKGATTFGGQPAIEVDESDATKGKVASTGQNFYAFLPQGYVLLDTKTTSSNGAGGINDSAYSPPYHLLIPETLSGNVPVTTPAVTETDSNSAAPGDTSTETISDVITLVSETPSAQISVPAGNFMCYQINSTETDTDSDGNVTTDVSEGFIDPSKGLVEVDDVTSGNLLELTNFTGTSFQLAVTQQPSNALVEDDINPAVQVSLQDSLGNNDTNVADAETITASIGSASTGTGTFTAMSVTSVNTVDGVANFSNLAMTKPGQYVLNFTDSDGRSIASNSFKVSAGKLIFKGRVSNGVAGSALEPSVEVELVNSKGKIINDIPSLVTLGISGTNSSNPIAGNTAGLVGGVAIFSGVKLGMPGKYVLNATDDLGDATASSNEFEITGLHIAFRRQPGKKVGLSSPLQYTVVLEDSRNRLVNNSSIGLQLTLNTVAGGTNAALSDRSDVFSFGVANNTTGVRASINSPGEYTITFAIVSEPENPIGYTIDPITSSQFQVVTDHLAFARGKEPATTLPGVALRFVVQMEDYQNHIVTTSADPLQFTLIPSSGDTGVLSSSSDTLLAGIDENAGMISINAAGTYKLMVVDVPADPGDPIADPVTSNPFKIKTVK
jgi:hypothetical protein